ncbi:hypothetical protein [Brevundimonas sp.]|uniref:hypothetical protein n=1 Tax=Brevundimonas sp. TaxID=1871086 RepID=UPI0026298725|nr:hypothetical protein [Brevundimonas sp.]
MRFMIPLVAAACLIAGTAQAQEYRFSANSSRGHSSQVEFPNVQVSRRADNLVVSVRVACDTRDSGQRRSEITQTLAAMARAAGLDAAIELGLDSGGSVVDFDARMIPTLRFHTDDGRPDTSAVTLVIKTPIAEGDTLEASSARIRAFIAATTGVGRTELRLMDDWEPTVIRPDQYRSTILAAIAADAGTTAGAFGPTYGVEVTGLSRQVTWRQAGPLELMLYIPYQLSVTPAG